MAILHFAPRTCVTIPEFDEIDGAVEFRAPAQGLNFAHALIHLNERAGTQQGVKREILKSNIAIEGVAQVQVLQQGDGNFTPDLNHAREQVGVIEVEGAIKADGEGKGSVRVVNLEIRKMRMREGRGELMLGNLVQVQAEEKHEVRKFDAVDGSQGVELENAGDGIGIFELRQPRIGNLEFGIFFFLGDFLA
jgi:hypothetical protein